MSQTKDLQMEHHIAALKQPRNFEKPLLGMIRALNEYAACHKRAYEFALGEAGGPIAKSFLEIVKQIRWGLLNGELNRLDGGEIDKQLLEILKENHFGEEDYR